MNSIIRNISIVFAAGSAGGFIKALLVAFFGASGLFEAFGMKLSLVNDPAAFYQRVITGGFFGLFLLIPLLGRKPAWRGFAMGFLPTMVEWSLVFPTQETHGMLGQDLGLATPVLLLLINSIWGLCASYWYKFANEEASSAAPKRRNQQQTLHYRGRTIIH